MVTRKAHSEEDRAASGRVTSPKELTAIQEEVAALNRRQTALEDDLLERMEQRETLEAELADLDIRRETITTEQAEVTRDRDAALVEIDADLAAERAAADEVAPRVDGGCGPSTTRSASARAGSGPPLWSATLPGLPGVDLRSRTGRAPQAAARDRQALRELPPHPGGRLTSSVPWKNRDSHALGDGPERGRFAVRRRAQRLASPRSHRMPCGNVQRRVHVHMRLVPAGDAPERLTLAVPRSDVPARRAALARVRGIDPFHPAGGLVFQPVQEGPPTRWQGWRGSARPSAGRCGRVGRRCPWRFSSWPAHPGPRCGSGRIGGPGRCSLSPSSRGGEPFPCP